MTDFPPSAATTDAVLHSVHITWKPGVDPAATLPVAAHEGLSDKRWI